LKKVQGGTAKGKESGYLIKKGGKKRKREYFRAANEIGNKRGKKGEGN